MSFADIIKQEQQMLEQQQGGNTDVKYPETKHKRLFYEKNQTELFLQVLPSAHLLNAAFAVPVRKIFLNAVSSKGKQINSNFTLDAQDNPGSVLEQKIAEWTEKKMIPSAFGGQQTPKRAYLVNVVKVIPNPANPQQWIQERDDKGDLVVRVFEMPQSAYSGVITKLQDPMLNTSGSELSFMDINKPAPLRIAKPPKGVMSYSVDVYSHIGLPPLGQGWENQLENLEAHAVPTERLEGGLEWVKAFIDMKEGRKPNGGNGGDQGNAAPASNPYGQAPQQPQNNPYGQAPQQPQYQQPPAAPPAAPQYQQQQQQQYQQPPVAPPAAPQQNQYQAPPQQPNTYQQQPPVAPPPPPAQMDDIGQEYTIQNDGNMAPAAPPAPATPPAMDTPPAPPVDTPAPPLASQNATSGPAHNAPVNNNGLADIDAMLDAELN